MSIVELCHDPRAVSPEEITVETPTELGSLVDQFCHLATQALIHPYILSETNRLPYHRFYMSATERIESFQALLFRYQPKGVCTARMRGQCDEGCLYAEPAPRFFLIRVSCGYVP